LVIGIGFFLKYSIDRGILGPQAISCGVPIASFGVACLVMLLVYLTLETNSFLHEYAAGLQAGGARAIAP